MVVCVLCNGLINDGMPSFSLREHTFERVSCVLAGIGVLVGVLLLLGPPAQAQQAGMTDDPSPHSEAELVSARSSVQPGEPFTVALRMTMDEGWHSYWRNPGDSGQRTSIDWALPEGFEADSIRWPYPERIETGPLVSYGYSDELYLLVQVRPPQDLEPGTTVRLAGTADWLICEEICYPATADVELELPVTETAPESTEWQSEIADARSRLPRSVDGWNAVVARSAGSYVLRLTPPSSWSGSLEEAYFFADEKGVVAHASTQPLSRQGEHFLIALQQSEYAQEPAERLSGVVVAGDGRSVWDEAGEIRALRVNAPVRESDEIAAAGEITGGGPPAGASAGGGMSLGWALLFALAGGMLLNLMPCVFPILSVKVLSFTEQAGTTRSRMRGHGLIFALGILASMWVLAGVLLALRAGGSEIGWGFQLQSPYFVGVMVLLFFGIGLSLLGVFEVGTSLMSLGGRLQNRVGEQGYLNSFLTGVLTTVVATPCTAPFMGAALGFAITLSAGGALLIFTALGAGIALPYVALSMAPRLLDRIPEPGPWMETLKQLLAFPMFATAVWLLWVFGQQAGVTGMSYLLLGILLIGLAAWVVSRWPAPAISTRARIVSRTLALVLAVAGVAIGVTGAAQQSGQQAVASTSSGGGSQSAEDSWESFSVEKVDRIRSEGRPVFVDFTAAWCLTCQVNKRTVLNTETVQEAFAEHDVALIKADWTNRDAEITRALESHGRSGVPLYVLYPGDGSDPRILPEVLTRDVVLDALESLPEPPSSRAAARSPSSTGSS